MPVAHAQQRLGGHRRVGIAYLHMLRFAESRSALNKSGCRRTEHYATRRCHRFHSLRQSDLFTNGGVTERPRTDLTGNHLPELRPTRNCGSTPSRAWMSTASRLASS